MQKSKQKQQRKTVKPIAKAKSKAKSNRSTYVNVGRTLGNFVSPAVGQLGALAGSAIARIMGEGDYSIKGNTLMTNQAPAFASTSNGFRVTHREYVRDITSSVNFDNSEYYINPGNSSLFRWLSTVALSYEKYEFHGLVFTYKPTSGTAISSTNAAMGSVILSTEYDVLKPLFTSKQDAEAYQFTTSCVPYQAMIHPVECKPSLTPLPMKFVTSAPSPSNLAVDDDPRLHYQGLFQAMTIGQQSVANSIGELWVSYDVSFYTPRAPSVTSTRVNVCHMIPWLAGTHAPTSGVPLFVAKNSPNFFDLQWGQHPSTGWGCLIAQCTTPGLYEVRIQSVNTANQLLFSSDFSSSSVSEVTYLDMSQYLIPPVTTQARTVAVDSASTHASVDTKIYRLYPGHTIYFPNPEKSTVSDFGAVQYMLTRLDDVNAPSTDFQRLATTSSLGRQIHSALTSDELSDEVYEAGGAAAGSSEPFLNESQVEALIKRCELLRLQKQAAKGK